MKPQIGDLITILQWRSRPNAYFQATVTDIEEDEDLGTMAYYEYPADGTEDPSHVTDGYYWHFAIFNDNEWQDGEF